MVVSLVDEDGMSLNLSCMKVFGTHTFYKGGGGGGWSRPPMMILEKFGWFWFSLSRVMLRKPLRGHPNPPLCTGRVKAFATSCLENNLNGFGLGEEWFIRILCEHLSSRNTSQSY